MEYRFYVSGYGDAGAGEAGYASMVAEEANGKEGTRVGLREDVGLAGGGWDVG